MRIRLESIDGLFLGWVTLLPPLLYHNSSPSIHIFIIACISCKRDGGGVVPGMWRLIL